MEYVVFVLNNEVRVAPFRGRKRVHLDTCCDAVFTQQGEVLSRPVNHD